MAQVAIKEIDLSSVINQLNQLNTRFRAIEQNFNKIDNGFDRISVSTQKFNKALSLSQRAGEKLQRTFSKIHGTLRFIAITPFSKGLALGMGALGNAWDFAKSTSEGTLRDLALARASGSRLKNLRAFDRAAELGGVSDVLSSQSMNQFKQNLNDVDMQGQVALLGSILGKDREAMNKMDTTDLFVHSLGALDKLVKELGGYDNLASNVRGKQILELLGLDISDLRAGNWSQFSSDYHSQKMQGINDDIFAKNERSMINLGNSFKDLKDTLITALMPSFTAFATKIQEVTRKLTKWLLDNKVLERFGKWMGQITDKALSFTFDNVIELLTVKLPRALYKVMGAITGLVAMVKTGSDGDELYLKSKIYEAKSYGLSEEMINQQIEMARRLGLKTRDRRLGDTHDIGTSLVNLAKSQQRVEVIIKAEPGLKADVVKSTSASNIGKGGY